MLIEKNPVEKPLPLHCARTPPDSFFFPPVHRPFYLLFFSISLSLFFILYFYLRLLVASSISLLFFLFYPLVPVIFTSFHLYLFMHVFVFPHYFLNFSVNHFLLHSSLPPSSFPLLNHFPLFLKYFLLHSSLPPLPSVFLNHSFLHSFPPLPSLSHKYSFTPLSPLP